ncbi:MAG: hypothetical protein HY718_11445, partial [Planctomycetes bacterium]|nr:hypothetical protein [Planctomycetota bacterium]
GYLEHRGVRHGLRELTEPDYRAASGDTFARGFDIDTFLATRDASMPAGHDASAETTAIWMGR